MIILVREQLKQGKLFPSGWFASTGIHEFPLFLLLPQAIFNKNWLLGSDFAQVAITLLMFAVIVFWGKTVMKNRAWLILLLLLASYVSEHQYDMLYLQCAYTGEVILVFGFFALYIRFAEAGSRKAKGVWAILCGGFLFFFCLFGIVTLETATIPLLGSLILVYLCQSADKAPTDIFRQKRLWCIVLVICIISFVGVFINIRILEPLVNLKVENNLLTCFAPFEEMLNGVIKIVLGFICYLGIEPGVPFFSFQGIMNFVHLGLMLPMTLIFPVLEIRRWKTLSKEKQLFVFYVVIYTTETILLLLCGNVGIAAYAAAARYELVMIVLLNALSCDYVYETYIKEERLISWVYGLIACCFLVITLPIMDGISTYPAQMQNMRGLTDYLQENDLRYGYASFWHAGKHTVLSDGKVQINGVVLGDSAVTPYLWLSCEDCYDPDTYYGETFLMLTEDEWQQFMTDGLSASVYGKPERELQYDGYHILVFDYNIAENGFSGRLDGTRNFLSSMHCSNEAMWQSDGSVRIASGDILYGPYIKLGSGSYHMAIDLTEATEITVTSDCGENVIGTYAITPENNHINFTFSEDCQNVEFVISGETPELIVTGIWIEEE